MGPGQQGIEGLQGNNDAGILSSLLDFFGSTGGSALLSGAAGGLLTNKAYDRLSNIGKEAQREANIIAERAQRESEFKPFTVTTPTGAMFRTQTGPFNPVISDPIRPPVFPVGDPSMVLPPSSGVGTVGKPGMVTPPRGFGRGYVEPSRPDMRMGLPTPPVAGDIPGIGEPLIKDLFPRIADGDGVFGSGQGRQNLLEGRRIKTNNVIDPKTLMPDDSGAGMQSGMPQPGPQATDGVNVEMALSPAEQALYQGLFGGAGNFFGQASMPTANREQAIFERMRAAQLPEEERQRQQLEQRLAAQGRLGVRTAQFGGTPEQLAIEKAQAEARNTAMLGAMQQAQAEQAQQAALGQQFLGAAYLPQAQMLAALSPAMRQQELAQQAQQFGTGLFSETGMSGLEARLIAEQARANLLGGIGSNILSGLFSPRFNSAGNVTNAGGTSTITDAIKALVKQLSGG